MAEGVVIGVGGEESGGRDVMAAAAAGRGAEAVGECSDAVAHGFKIE